MWLPSRTSDASEEGAVKETFPEDILAQDNRCSGAAPDSVVPGMLQVMGNQEGAVSVARQGCGLGNNLDVAVCRAEWLFHQGAYQAR